MTRMTLIALALGSLTACSTDFDAPADGREGDIDAPADQPDVVEDEEVDEADVDIEDEPEEVIDEPLVEVFGVQPAMSTIVYSPEGAANAVSDVCIGEFEDIEVVDGLFDAELNCILQTYGNVYRLDFEGELFADGSLEGTVTMTLNGRSHTDELESALVNGQTRVYWQGTWEYLATSHIDYIGSMDLE